MNSPLAALRGCQVWLGTGFFALIFATAHAAPATTPPLPEPLTLEYALSLAATVDPELQQAHADVALAKAEQEESAAASGLQAALQARAFRVEPSSVAVDQGQDDSSIGLVVRKPLFDFGRSSASLAAARAEVQGSEWRLLGARQQRRLTIMARYFEVLLADLAADRAAQALAVADKRYQRAVASQQLGRISRIERGAEQAGYLAAKREQLDSDTQRRATRSALADSLNHSGRLPATLAKPALLELDRPVPNSDALMETAQTHNPLLQAQRARIEAARQRVQAARAQRLPIVSGELAAANYSQQTDERNDWQAGVTLEVPLYSGGRTQAAVAARLAELQQTEADYAQAQQTLRQSLQGTLDEIATLQMQREQARVQLEYRDLALQRSRGMGGAGQQHDIAADQEQLTAAQLFQAETDYQLALAWARLDALLGASGIANAAVPSNEAAITQPLKN